MEFAVGVVVVATFRLFFGGSVPSEVGMDDGKWIMDEKETNYWPNVVIVVVDRAARTATNLLLSPN